MEEEALYEQLVRLCQPTVQKIENKRRVTCKPKMFLCHSDAAACNLQENIDFDQDLVIETTIIQWIQLSLAHVHTGTDIRLDEFLGAFIEITEEVPIHDKEVPVLKMALLETMQLFNADALTFPIACKILTAGLQESLLQQNRVNPGKLEIHKELMKLIHATSNVTVSYTKANIKFLTQ